MAEIRDTQGLKADLKTYQSRPAVYRDPGQSRKINDGSSKEKMWNSVSKSLETIIKTKIDMDLAAQDLEKDKIATEIADHYRNLSTNVNENLMALPDGDLSGKKFGEDYATGKVHIKNMNLKLENIRIMQLNRCKLKQIMQVAFLSIIHELNFMQN